MCHFYIPERLKVCERTCFFLNNCCIDLIGKHKCFCSAYLGKHQKEFSYSLVWEISKNVYGEKKKLSPTSDSLCFKPLTPISKLVYSDFLIFCRYHSESYPNLEKKGDKAYFPQLYPYIKKKKIKVTCKRCELSTHLLL